MFNIPFCHGKTCIIHIHYRITRAISISVEALHECCLIWYKLIANFQRIITVNGVFCVPMGIFACKPTRACIIVPCAEIQPVRTFVVVLAAVAEGVFIIRVGESFISESVVVVFFNCLADVFTAYGYKSNHVTVGVEEIYLPVYSACEAADAIYRKAVYSNVFIFRKVVFRDYILSVVDEIRVAVFHPQARRVIIVACVDVAEIVVGIGVANASAEATPHQSLCDSFSSRRSL